MNPPVQDEFRVSFFQECEELLESMNEGFEAILRDEHDDDTIHAIFRAVHSIKGGASAFGLDALVAFAHRFETGLDSVRSGTTPMSDDLLSLLQRCGDHLSDQVVAARDEVALDADLTEHLCSVLTETTGATGPDNEGEENTEPDFQPAMLELDFTGPATGAENPQPTEEESNSEVLIFKANDELFLSGNEPIALIRSCAKQFNCSTITKIDNVPALSEFDPSHCTFEWHIENKESDFSEIIEDAFEFVSDCCSLEVKKNNPSIGEFPPGTPELNDKTISDKPPVTKVPQENSTSRDPSKKDKAQNTKAPKEITKTSATIRVDLERVDKLINLVGELVIKEAMLSQSVSSLDLPAESEVSAGLESLKQLAGEIQEGVMAIRAQPVKPIFQRMARTVRDASLATGKQVRLDTRGEYTEVDKTVLERLVDPLTHMVRNAIDHGLETTEQRKSTGKPPIGTVTLSAAHRSGRVIIEISDDGAGVDRELVKKKAEQKGLIEQDADIAPNEIDNLLFLPGFSSKDNVSELSGRGVGLDVARNEIAALGGRLNLTSIPNRGSTFTISMPLTLAVLEGMVVDVGGETMIVPITAIQETIQPRAATIHTVGTTANVLATRDGLVPIVDLGASFGLRTMPEDLNSHVLLVIETDANKRCALLVDSIQDQRQVVIKSLETNYQRIEGIAAATILGDGRIALIIDPDSIVNETLSTAAPNSVLTYS